MSQRFEIGDKVKWNWGSSEAHGEVRRIDRRKVTRMIKGSEITRNGTQEEPAYDLMQDDGDEVLKSQSEFDLATVDQS